MSDEKSTKIYKSLAETFDVEDVVDTSRKSDVPATTDVAAPADRTLESDSDEVRDTLFDLLREGKDAFEDLKRIAVAEESPRAFEVLNSMLSNLSDISLKILAVHEKKDKISKSVKTDQPQQGAVNNGVVNNNTVFVGTTTDLQDMIRNLNLDKK